MAKLTREICDFCGGQLGHPHGILQVPKPFWINEPTLASLLSAVGYRLGYQDFDICRACCDGLVNARSATVKVTVDGFEKA